VPEDLLERMRGALGVLVERSREITKSDDNWVLQDDHTAAAPRLRRVYRVADHHPTFWEFASRSILPEVVGDLVGPDVKFRESYVNFKWSKGGDAVQWHQDTPFFPHTNRALVTTMILLADVTPDMGPIAVVPRSHHGPMYEHYDDRGHWTGHIGDADVESAATETAVSFCGPAGTVVFMDSWAVHGSRRNDSGKGRPLLITGHAAADAFAYTAMPPDWSGGYTSIFEDQQGRARQADAAGPVGDATGGR
jgi:ectoine hydroxylase